MFMGVGGQVRGRRLEAAGRDVMLVPQLSTVMMLPMMLGHIMVAMVGGLVFGDVDVVPVGLRTIDQAMLSLVPILRIHIEVVAKRVAHRRSRRGWGLVTERSSSRGRAGPVLVTVTCMLRRIKLPGSRLMEPERTICHLTGQTCLSRLCSGL